MLLVNMEREKSHFTNKKRGGGGRERVSFPASTEEDFCIEERTIVTCLFVNSYQNRSVKVCEEESADNKAE